jgi:hypothetical protein
MASIRPFLFAAALPLTLVACGGDDGGTGPVTPEGDHYQQVAKKAYVPKSNTEAREYTVDLGSPDGTLDGTPDNQLGMVLSTLASPQFGFDVQGTIDEAVATGSIILLVDFQTTSFDSASAAGLKIMLGDDATATPAPCNTGEMWDETTMTGCGHHLTGSGNFTLTAGQPDNAPVTGKIAGGVFTGGPGELTLQIALGSTEALTLDLIGARAKASGISATGMTSLILAGALTEEDLNTKVMPAIQQQITPLIGEDCTMLSSPPSCGCASGSTGETILQLFDTNPQDCAVSVDEIKGNTLIQSLLAPDVKIDGVDALSLGIKVETTTAMFPSQE